MRVHRNMQLALFPGAIAGVMAAALVAPRPALADNEPVIVVPGRAGVPVMMYGIDVSGAVIEGEWGLNRPGVVAPTVILRYWPHELYGEPGPYFPATGQRPRYGRLEIIPPPHRRLPTPAQPFYRDWMSQSAPGPVTIPVPYDPPPVVVAPHFARSRPHGPSSVPHAPHHGP
jgi:hypothetical protein